MEVSTKGVDGAEHMHRRAVVIDGMNNAGLSRAYFEQILAGGISATMVPVSISDPFPVAVEKILALRELVDANEDLVRIVETTADIHSAKSEGHVGLILALEDSRAVEKDLRKVRLFRDLGVRRMQLVYTTLNDVGCGAGDRVDVGLSRFGEALVAELQAQSILIDLCHAGPQTHADAVQRISSPCVWSHTNIRAIHDHPNNLTDEQVDAVAANGGVIGISAVPFYTGGRDATIESVLDHVDYVRDRIGVEHVAIGTAIFENHPRSFYDQFASLPVDVYGEPPWAWPPGISTISDFPNLTTGLLARGYSATDVSNILGGNYLRVLATAWGEEPAAR